MKRKFKYVESNDLLRYRRGEMPESEKNSFERELQRDPFLEEALDGFESVAPEKAEAELAGLEIKLAARTGRRRSRIFYRIAASVAVLVILSSVFMLLRINKEATPGATLAVNERVTLEIEESSPVISPSETPKKRSEPAPSIPEYAPVPATSDAPEKISDKNIPPVKVEKKDEIQVAEADATDKSAKPENRQLMKEEISAVQPAAALRARSATDSSIPSARNDEKAAGRAAVTVEGYGTTAGYTPPAPEGGIDEFEKYLINNIVKPGSASIEKIVVATFKVLKDGSLDSIKIIRSPGRLYSDEAIRLLRSGPAWKPATRDGNNVEEEVRVRIVFPD